MGRRGRKPEAERTKKIRPTDDAPDVTKSAAFPVGLPEPPPGLGAVCKRYWQETIEALAAVPGHLSPVDRHALEMYCRTWEEYHQANNAIKREGLRVGAAPGNVHPLHAVKAKAIAHIKHYQARFGLTPGDRQSMKLGGPPADKNPFEEYLAKHLENN